MSDTLKPFSSIGYREILLYIKGSIRYEDMVKDIKKHTRHYAKRQFTWFAKEKDMYWFEYPDDSEAITTKVDGFLRHGIKENYRSNIVPRHQNRWH